MPKSANRLCNLSRDSKSSPEQDETIPKRVLPVHICMRVRSNLVPSRSEFPHKDED